MILYLLLLLLLLLLLWSSGPINSINCFAIVTILERTSVLISILIGFGWIDWLLSHSAGGIWKLISHRWFISCIGCDRFISCFSSTADMLSNWWHDTYLSTGNIWLSELIIITIRCIFSHFSDGGRHDACIKWCTHLDWKCFTDVVDSGLIKFWWPISWMFELQVGTFANALVFAVFYRRPSLRTISNR